MSYSSTGRKIPIESHPRKYPPPPRIPRDEGLRITISNNDGDAVVDVPSKKARKSVIDRLGPEVAPEHSEESLRVTVGNSLYQHSRDMSSSRSHYDRHRESDRYRDRDNYKDSRYHDRDYDRKRRSHSRERDYERRKRSSSRDRHGYGSSQRSRRNRSSSSSSRSPSRSPTRNKSQGQRARPRDDSSQEADIYQGLPPVRSQPSAEEPNVSGLGLLAMYSKDAPMVVPQTAKPVQAPSSKAQVSNIMDIDDEEAFLYGGSSPTKPSPTSEACRPASDDNARLGFSQDSQPSVTGHMRQSLSPPRSSQSASGRGSREREGDKSKEQYDPTIENILRSIGFNFEMSKMMQKQAEVKKPDEIVSQPEPVSIPSQPQSVSSEDRRKESYEEKARRYRQMKEEAYMYGKSSPTPFDSERERRLQEKPSKQPPAPSPAKSSPRAPPQSSSDKGRRSRSHSSSSSSGSSSSSRSSRSPQHSRSYSRSRSRSRSPSHGPKRRRESPESNDKSLAPNLAAAGHFGQDKDERVRPYGYGLPPGQYPPFSQPPPGFPGPQPGYPAAPAMPPLNMNMPPMNMGGPPPPMGMPPQMAGPPPGMAGPPHNMPLHPPMGMANPGMCPPFPPGPGMPPGPMPPMGPGQGMPMRGPPAMQGPPPPMMAQPPVSRPGDMHHQFAPEDVILPFKPRHTLDIDHRDRDHPPAITRGSPGGKPKTRTYDRELSPRERQRSPSDDYRKEKRRREDSDDRNRDRSPDEKKRRDERNYDSYPREKVRDSHDRDRGKYDDKYDRDRGQSRDRDTKDYEKRDRSRSRDRDYRDGEKRDHGDEKRPEKDTDRDRSHDKDRRYREQSHDSERDRNYDRDKDHYRDKKRDKSYEREKEKSYDRERGGSYDRESGRGRDKGYTKDRDEYLRDKEEFIRKKKELLLQKEDEYYRQRYGKGSKEYRSFRDYHKSKRSSRDYDKHESESYKRDQRDRSRERYSRSPSVKDRGNEKYDPYEDRSDRSSSRDKLVVDKGLTIEVSQTSRWDDKTEPVSERVVTVKPSKKTCKVELSDKEKKSMLLERETRQKRLDVLETELDRLKRQQNEMMRKKQKQKDGHKDPLLSANGQLQVDVRQEIEVLKRAMKTNDQLLLDAGVDIPVAVKAEIKFEEPPKESLPPEPVKTESMDQDYRDKYKDYKDRDERREYADVDYRKQDKYDDRYLKEEDSSRDKYDDKYSRDRYSQRERSSSRAGSDRVKYEEPEAEVKREIRISSRTEESTEPQSGSSFEFYDAGNHWCRLCNVVGTNVYELFNHLQSKKHTQKMDPYSRPWLPDSLKDSKPKEKKPGAVVVPIKGVEFLMPVAAFFCSLCDEFSGDVICAEDHLKTEKHDTNYRKYCASNPYYERRYNLDKAAGLSLQNKERGDHKDDPDQRREAEQMKERQMEKEREMRRREDEKRRQEDEDRRRDRLEAERSKINWKEERVKGIALSKEIDVPGGLTAILPDDDDLEVPPTHRRFGKSEEKQIEEDKQDSASKIKIKLGKGSSKSLKTKYNPLEEKSSSKPKIELSADAAALLQKVRQQKQREMKEKEKAKEDKVKQESFMEDLKRRAQEEIRNKAKVKAEARAAEEKAQSERQAKKEKVVQDELDMFLSVGGSESLPVIKETSPAQAADGKSDKNHCDEAEKEEREKQEDMALLGIDIDNELNKKAKAPPATVPRNTKPSKEMASEQASGLYDIYYGKKAPAEVKADSKKEKSGGSSLMDIPLPDIPGPSPATETPTAGSNTSSSSAPVNTLSFETGEKEAALQEASKAWMAAKSGAPPPMGPPPFGGPRPGLPGMFMGGGPGGMGRADPMFMMGGPPMGPGPNPFFPNPFFGPNMGGGPPFRGRFGGPMCGPPPMMGGNQWHGPGPQGPYGPQGPFSAPPFMPVSTAAPFVTSNMNNYSSTSRPDPAYTSSGTADKTKMDTTKNNSVTKTTASHDTKTNDKKSPDASEGKGSGSKTEKVEGTSTEKDKTSAVDSETAACSKTTSKSDTSVKASILDKPNGETKTGDAAGADQEHDGKSTPTACVAKTDSADLIPLPKEEAPVASESSAPSKAAPGENDDDDDDKEKKFETPGCAQQ